MKDASVLIADDEKIVRDLVRGILETEGLRCQECEDGEAALAALETNSFQLLLTDIRMPRMDGLELARRAKKVQPNLAVMVMTGFTREYSYDKVNSVGAIDFIRKPFTIIELKGRVNRILREKELEEKEAELRDAQRRLNKKLSTLLMVAGTLNSVLDFDRLFPVIIQEVTEVMRAERSSLYLIDWERKEIWTKVAEKIGQIRLPIGQGISGHVAETGETINVKDARETPYFCDAFDRHHNYRTRSVLCVPMQNRAGERIGVLQVINKLQQDRFDEEDERLLEGLGAQVAIALENASLMKELEVSFESSIRTLSATVDAKHPLTAGHSQRVTEYALIISRRLGLDAEAQKVVKYAALLHDIGKIGIPDQVLLKKGRFTPEERAEMQSHAEKSRRILEKFHFPTALQEVPVVAGHHHEMMNGKGYPSGLKGEDIPLGSRILAVADVFDALTSLRDYPKYTRSRVLSCAPMPLSKVVDILLRNRGEQFDAQIVDVFMEDLPLALRRFRGTHFPAEYVDSFLDSR